MRASAVLFAAVLVASCATPDRHPAPAPAAELPAAPGSSGIRVFGSGGNALSASWIEPRGAGHALRVALRRDGAWAAPLDAAAGDDWVVSRVDLPAVVAGADGSLAAAWLAKSGGGEWAYGVLCAVSTNGGKAWSPPARPHRDAVAAEHGFVTVVPIVGGGFDVLWLDGREIPSGGATALRHAVLGSSGTFGDETVLDARVCDCCPTDAARTAGGALVVVYRDRAGDEVRDISVLRRDPVAGWSEPRTVAADGWRIAGCPVNGPAVDADDADVTCAWFTVGGGEPAVRVAFSTDDGRGFAAPIRVDDGDPLGHADVLLGPAGDAIVSWWEQTQDGAELRVRRVGADGTLGAMHVAATAHGGAPGLARLAREGDEAWIAWAESGDAGGVRASRLPDGVMEGSRGGSGS